MKPRSALAPALCIDLRESSSVAHPTLTNVTLLFGRSRRTTTLVNQMPRSSRANPTDVVVDQEYEARIAAITVGKAAGGELGGAVGKYLAGDNKAQLGAGIMKGLKTKASNIPAPKKAIKKPAKKAAKKGAKK